MCNCLKQIEERAKNELPLKNSEYSGIKILRAEFENKCFDITDHCKLKLYIPLKIEWDTVTKKGKTIHRHKVINITGHYCPFCGERLEDETK